MLRITDALAQIEAVNQRRNAAGDVDNRAAGKIQRGETATYIVQQSAHAPDHVGHRAIDNERPERKEDAMALNFMRSAKAPEISAGVMMANIN